MLPTEHAKRTPGQTAIQLLRELKEVGGLAPFPGDKKAAILQEIENHYALATEMKEWQAEPEEQGTQLAMYLYHMGGCMRNKQCFLAYLKARLSMIERLYWEVGVFPEGVKENLSQAEQDHFSWYNGLVGNYMRNCGQDFSEYFSHPPCSTATEIEVSVLEDHGEYILRESCTPIVLKRGKRFLLDVVDAEYLIRMGKVEHVSGV